MKGNENKRLYKLNHLPCKLLRELPADLQGTKDSYIHHVTFSLQRINHKIRLHLQQLKAGYV